MPARRLVTSPRRFVFVALFVLGVLGAMAALTLLPPAADRKASAQASLDECHDLALETYINDFNGDYFLNYRVGNRTDETLTNVKVVIQSATPFQDGTTGSTYYTDDGIIYRNAAFSINDNTGTYPIDTLGSAWVVNSVDGRADRSDWAAHWLMPTMGPAASPSLRTFLTGSVTTSTVRIRRNTVTMTQLAADGTTALCQTQRVYWTRSYARKLRIIEPSYGVALSADERYPAAGDTVNFKVGVNARHSYGVNARVAHTSGLTLNTASVTEPPKTEWKDYEAAKGQGDFWIGTENVLAAGAALTATYEITLPFQVKSGEPVSEQCVTVTVTGLPEAGPRVSNQAADDPTDNTATVCLGQLPLFQEDGTELALWTVYPCVGTGATTFPCNSADTLEVASVNETTKEILSAGPAKVNAFIKLDPVQSATVDTHWASVHTYYDSSWKRNPNKVSWVTKRTCPLVDDGHGHLEEDCSLENHQSVPGTAIELSLTQFDSTEAAKWNKFGLLASVSGVGPGLDNLPAQYGNSCAPPHNNNLPTIVGGLPTLPAPPGGMRGRYDSTGNWHLNLSAPDTKAHPSTYPRHKWKSNTDLSSFTDVIFAEFGAIGTYVVDYHASASRATDTTHANPYCDTLRTVFHVGPMAELGVWDDGDANPDLPSNQVAYTLTLANVGPDGAEAAQALVELPDDATSVRTIPPGYGTFHAAGTVAGVSHGPYWLWDVGELPAADTERTYRRPQGREVTLVVGGASAGDTATATVSNGNGHCEVGTATLPHVIRTEDCAAINADTSNSVTTAAWVLDNPYTLCLNYDTTDKVVTEVLPKPASETACTATSGNSWHAGTVLDHHQGNNVATLTARAGGADASSAGAKTVTTPFTYVTLSWPAATDAAEYRVFRSTTGATGSYQRIAKIAASDSPTYTDETVLADATYYYHVDALYPSQKLAEIHTMSITATMEPLKSKEAPGNVVGLTAARQQTDATKIDVTWKQPTIDASDATRYDVLYRSRPSGGSWTDWNEAAKEQTTLTYTLSNAGGGTTHQFRVRGVNLVDGDSHPGNWSTATVQPLKNPEQVQGLTATRNFNKETEINVTWGKPAAGTDPTRYEVQYQSRTGNSGSWGNTWTDQPDVTHDSARTTPFKSTLDPAVGAKSYRFQVRTVNVTGNDTIYGQWQSNNASIVPAVTIPHQVNNLTATRDATNDSIIDLSWTAPSNATGATRYNVQYQVDGSGTWLDVTGTPTITHPYASHRLTGATGANRYQFRVQAVTTRDGSDLTGNWRNSSTVPVVGAPNRVGTVTATRTNETTIDVEWTAPTGGNTPTGYYVQRKVNGGEWDTATQADVTSGTKYTLTDADGDSGYQFQVQAYKTLQSTTRLLGPWRSSNTLPGLPAGDIASVTASRTKDGDDTTIDVDWDPSSRVVTYQVQYRTNSGSWRSATTTASDVTTYKRENAGGVETYQFRVRGVNGNGNGEWTVSNEVEKPDLKYHGAVVGVDYVTLEMTSGPWWYKFRKNGDWGNCTRVASGSVTITGLWPSMTHAAGLYTSSGCSEDRIGGLKTFVTLSDIYDWEHCWNADDCRDIDNPNNFNQHTHKRSRLGALGVNRPDCAYSRELHSHGWPDGGGGQHWHCPN